MNSGIILVVQLFINADREAEFRQFEMEAARIMKNYGGQIEKVIRPIISEQKEALPQEIHIVSFPSLKDFEVYQEDSDLAKLTTLRQCAIARTEITIGKESKLYF
jgi:antibiotic biosynthesis monooxygenase (ABM) superfamily enzyme